MNCCQICKKEEFDNTESKKLYTLCMTFYLKVIQPIEGMSKEKGRKRVHDVQNGSLQELGAYIKKSYDEFKGIQTAKLLYCKAELEDGVHHNSTIIEINEAEQIAIFESCTTKDLIAFYYKDYEILYIKDKSILAGQGFKAPEDVGDFHYLVYKIKNEASVSADAPSSQVYVLDEESKAVAQCVLIKVENQDTLEMYMTPYGFILYQ